MPDVPRKQQVKRHTLDRDECAAMLVDALKAVPEPPGGWTHILAGFACIAHDYVTNLATSGRAKLGTRRCKHCGANVVLSTFLADTQKMV